MRELTPSAARELAAALIEAAEAAEEEHKPQEVVEMAEEVFISAPSSLSEFCESALFRVVRQLKPALATV